MALLRSFATALLALAFAATAGADPVAFGDRSIEIPAPPGMVPVSKDVPGYIAHSQSYLPQGSRLVEAYVPPAVRDALVAGEKLQIPRYYQLHSMREMDGRFLSDEEFASGLKAMEAGIVAQAAELDRTAAELAAQGNARSDSRVGLGGAQMHGIFRREPWGLFFSSSVEVTLDVDARAEAIRMVSGNAIMLADNQLLFLYSYADATDPAARAEAERSVSAWADAIRGGGAALAAAGAAPAEPTAAKPDAAPNAGWMRGLGIGLAVLLVAVGIIVAWSRSRSAR